MDGGLNRTGCQLILHGMWEFALCQGKMLLDERSRWGRRQSMSNWSRHISRWMRYPPCAGSCYGYTEWYHLFVPWRMNWVFWSRLWEAWLAGRVLPQFWSGKATIVKDLPRFKSINAGSLEVRMLWEDTRGSHTPLLARTQWIRARP